MAEDSMLWNTTGTGDGPGSGYTQQNWLDLHRYFFTPDMEATAGILPRKGNKLAVTAGASLVNVDTGAAMCYGFFYKNTASLVVNITTPLLGTTGLRVVLRANWAAQTVRAAVVRNSDGVAAVPAATQVAGTTWEITLATGTITTGGLVVLTDTRAYLAVATTVIGSMLDTSVADNATLELITNTLRIKDLGVTTAKINNLAVTTGKLALNAVDDTIAGDRVPQFYRRQGGNASDWSIVGNTNQTPTSVRMQAGVKAITFTASTTSPGATVTSPQAFSNKPIVLIASMDDNGAFRINIAATVLSTTQFFISASADVAMTETIEIAWLAIGPE